MQASVLEFGSYSFSWYRFMDHNGLSGFQKPALFRKVSYSFMPLGILEIARVAWQSCRRGDVLRRPVGAVAQRLFIAAVNNTLSGGGVPVHSAGRTAAASFHHHKIRVAYTHTEVAM